VFRAIHPCLDHLLGRHIVGTGQDVLTDKVDIGVASALNTGEKARLTGTLMVETAVGRHVLTVGTSRSTKRRIGRKGRQTVGSAPLVGERDNLRLDPLHPRLAQW
jgi:hypothetical protein